MSDSAEDPFPPRPRRDSVFLKARIESSDHVVECRVRNLSETGVCIDDPVQLPRDGRVLVTMGALHHLEGRVRWTQDGRAGLSFDRGQADVAAARQPRGAVSEAPKHLVGWLANIHNPYRRGDG